MKPRKSMLYVLPLLACLMVVQGCAGVLVGAAASVGVAAYDERGVAGVAQDTKIATLIRAAYFDTEIELLQDVGLEVYEGRVLVTGIVPTEEMRADAVRLAWQVADVKDVINELIVNQNTTLTDAARDTWITTKLKASLTGDETIFSINYGIETVNGIVYLIGIAQDQGELNRVIAHAREVERVRRVVSHVRVKAPAS